MGDTTQKGQAALRRFFNFREATNKAAMQRLKIEPDRDKNRAFEKLDTLWACLKDYEVAKAVHYNIKKAALNEKSRRLANAIIAENNTSF